MKFSVALSSHLSATQVQLLHQVVRITLIIQHIRSEVIGNKRIIYIKDQQIHLNFMVIILLYYGH